MKVTTAPKTSLSQKLVDALNDGRPTTSVNASQLPGKQAKADAAAAAKQFDGVSVSRFDFGKNTFYAIDKSAEDAFDDFDFYSKSGKFVGTQEVDM